MIENLVILRPHFHISGAGFIEPVFIVEESSFDELPVARGVADAQGMQFFGERVHADVASLIPMMVHYLGEPADPYAMGIYLVSKLATAHVKVALSGDGGDESFAGYDRYLGQKLVDIYDRFQKLYILSKEQVVELVKPWTILEPGFVPLEDWVGLDRYVTEEMTKAFGGAHIGAILEKK